MYSVILNSNNTNYSFNSFYEKFMQICEEHKKENRALLFAFILYDFENAQIAKVLKDPDYWLSLNALSGKYLTIFSLHYKPKVRYKKEKASSDMFVMRLMTSSSVFDNPSENSNLLIEKYFGKTLEVKYPSVLFFQIHDNKIIDYTLIELDETEIEPSFLELKSYISRVVDTLKEITDENKGNSKEIFSLVDTQVKGLRGVKVAKKVVKKVTSLTELGAAIAGLGT